MKKPLLMGLTIAGLTAFTPIGLGFTQGMTKKNCMYLSSLHYTAEGMSYWYDKANGGLETITGVPYEQLACSKCHVASCDACHLTEADGKPSYSTQFAKKQKTCLKCHAREAHMIMKIDQAQHTEGVHFASGMTCMDCHTTQDVHGDGVAYNSMKEPGAVHVKCEQCHDAVSSSRAHTVHGDKLDCKACHVRQVVSCNSCHFETMLKDKKRVSRPVTGWKFLMNYEGKVTSANMQSFVAQENKTFILFAPQFSHSVMRGGSKCEECHATPIVDQIFNHDDLTLSWLQEDGKKQNLKGVIPVVDGVQYHCVYEDFADGTWTPIAHPAVPKVQYVGYGTPLTKEQLEKMEQPQKSEELHSSCPNSPICSLQTLTHQLTNGKIEASTNN